MTPTILNFAQPSDFVRYLVQSSSLQTILLVCHDRETFLEHIASSLSNAEERTEDAETTDRPVSPAREVLLSHTLQMVGRSKHVKLVFCPRLDLLRAFLAGKLPGMGGTTRCVLAVLDVLALHHDTNEFSVQGLSRTLSLLVEMAAFSGMDLLLNECQDFHDMDDTRSGSTLWDSPVPLLSGSVKLPGEGSKWAGRTLLVKKVAARWFQFRAIPTDEERNTCTARTNPSTSANS